MNLNELEASDCIQCQECGMCFASEPSYKKHLFLLHRIKKSASKCVDEAAEDQVEDDNYAYIEEEQQTTSEAVLRRQCNVCRQAFATELALRRHFRSHGMSFITQQT